MNRSGARARDCLLLDRPYPAPRRQGRAGTNERDGGGGGDPETSYVVRSARTARATRRIEQNTSAARQYTCM